MNYVKIIKTDSGCVWLMNASENGIYTEHFASKTEFQRNVSSLIVENAIGDYSISHHNNGAPKLNGQNGKHLSISHSKDFFSVYYSEIEPVGVDIEIVNRDLSKGQHYFLNESELLTEWTNQQLHIIWSAKETMFKLTQGKIENLISSVTVKTINQNNVILDVQGEILEFGLHQFDSGVLVHS